MIYSFKVGARNSVGISLDSLPVSIRAARIPDPPIELQNVPVITTAYQIGLDWSVDGVYDGGSPILDYMLHYKEDQAVLYSVYESNIVDSYITVVGLTPGTTY